MTPSPQVEAEPVATFIERLRTRAESEREIQRNNEAVAAALSGQLEAFDRHDGSHNTFAVRLGLEHRNCAKRDAELARDWDEAASRLEAAEAKIAVLDPAAESFHRRMVSAEAQLAAMRADLYLVTNDRDNLKDALFDANLRLSQKDAALRPFLGDATMEKILWGDMPDDATGTVTVKLGDFRRARSALSPEPMDGDNGTDERE